MQVLQDCCLHGPALAAAICGCTADDTTDFRVQDAFRVVLEDDEADTSGLSTSSVTLQCLWAVLDTWDIVNKRAFVKFVTGTSRSAQKGCSTHEVEQLAPQPAMVVTTIMEKGCGM